MPKPAQIKTTFSTMLPIIEQMLIDAQLFGAGLSDLGASRIRIVIDDRLKSLPLLQQPQDVWLRPSPEYPDRIQFASTGRADRRVVRVLRVTIRTRSNVDPVGSDKQFLLRDDAGHFDLEDAIISTLDGEHVFDSNLNQLTTNPMEYTGITDPEKPDGDTGYGASVITFEVPYRRAIEEE